MPSVNTVKKYLTRVYIKVDVLPRVREDPLAQEVEFRAASSGHAAQALRG